jgi:NhaP-type Na+/H+ or K+/H+ antiporter
VVAFSIFVQGLTMEPLMRRLGLIREPAVTEVPDEAETRPA